MARTLSVQGSVASRGSQQLCPADKEELPSLLAPPRSRGPVVGVPHAGVVGRPPQQSGCVYAGPRNTLHGIVSLDPVTARHSASDVRTQRADRGHVRASEQWAFPLPACLTTLLFFLEGMLVPLSFHLKRQYSLSISSSFLMVDGKPAQLPKAPGLYRAF